MATKIRLQRGGRKSYGRGRLLDEAPPWWR